MGKRRDNEFWGLHLLAGLAIAVGCGGDDGSAPIMGAGSGMADGGDVGGDDGDDDDDEGDDDDDDDGPSDGPDDDDDDDDNGDDDDDDDDDDDSAGSCDLGMEVAIQVSVDVAWDGGIAVVEGAGAIDAWLLGRLDPDGTDVHLTGRVCRLSLPDFQTGAIAGGETYGTLFPDAIWASPGMPVVDAWAEISSADPGGTLNLPDGAVVLGANLADPLGDPWPANWDGVAGADHDGDGNPGITSVAKTGGAYAYPRIDILNSNARAEALFLASRTIMAFDGVIDSCDSASGSATMSMENHALGCRVLGGGSCSGGQTGTLDGNLPVFQIQGGSFELERVPDGASCEDVFALFP